MNSAATWTLVSFRTEVKARKTPLSHIACTCNVSVGHLRRILAGHWPHYGASMLPEYLHRYAETHWGMPPTQSGGAS